MIGYVSDILIVRNSENVRLCVSACDFLKTNHTDRNPVKNYTINIICLVFYINLMT